MDHSKREVKKFPTNMWGETRREITAIWDCGDGREVRMNAYHYPRDKKFGIFVGDHRRQGNSLTCSPMSHARVASIPVARYSKKALEKVFDEYVDSADVKLLVKHYAENPTI